MSLWSTRAGDLISKFHDKGLTAPVFAYLCERCLGPTMSLSNEELLSQAQAWRFVCGLDEQGEIVISAPGEGEWLIKSKGDRWLLIVHGLAQVNFYAEDVLKFLERRRR